MAITKSEVITVSGEGSPGEGSAHFTAVVIDHEEAVARMYGFQLDQYELDAFTMWLNEVMARHATQDG